MFNLSVVLLKCTWWLVTGSHQQWGGMVKARQLVERPQFKTTSLPVYCWEIVAAILLATHQVFQV